MITANFWKGNRSQAARIGFLILGGWLLTGCGPMNHNTFQPVDVQPVTFWWHFNPAQRGEWDYFSQVPHPYQAVPVLQAVGPAWSSHESPMVGNPPMLLAKP